jgi:hypothetical protein
VTSRTSPPENDAPHKAFPGRRYAILIGLIYLSVSDRSLTAQDPDRAGALFFFAINLCMSSAMGVLHIFAEEKAVFARAFGSGY